MQTLSSHFNRSNGCAVGFLKYVEEVHFLVCADDLAGIASDQGSGPELFFE